MSKILPIKSTQSSSQDFDFRRQSKREKKKESPAVINHIITEQERKKMKQLALPFDDNAIEVKIFELYLYSKSLNHRYRTYGKHIDYTVAVSVNAAEELFSKSYPSWWQTMGVKEVQAESVRSNLEQLEQQVETCKFVLEAVRIIQE
jgi:hypothetical protein